MKYYIFVFALFTCVSNASDIECETKLAKYQSLFENHVTLTYMDKLESLLFIREEIINEGAINSQERLDQQLYSSIKSVLNSHGIQPDHVVRIKAILEVFETYPLMVTAKESVALNDMVNQFGVKRI